MNFNLKKIMLAGLCFANLLQANQFTGTFYQKLGEMVLTAEEPLATANDKPTLSMYGQSQPQQQEEQVDLTVKMPARTEQLQTWFTLLDQVAPVNPQNRVFNYDVAEKLNLLSGTSSDKKHSIIGALPLKNTIGTASAAEMLTTPSAAEQNQEIVRYFAENPEVLRAAQKALKKIEAGTGLYLTFFKQMNKAEEEAFAKVFYGEWLGKGLGFNKSAPALYVLRAWQRSWNAIGFTPFLTFIKWFSINNFKHFAINTVREAAPKGISEKIHESSFLSDVLFKSAKNAVYDTAISHAPWENNSKICDELTETRMNFLNMPKNVCVPSYGKYINYDLTKYWSLKDNIRWTNDSSVLQGYLLASYLIPDAIHAYSAYCSAQNIAFDNTLMENLQVRLMGVAKIAEGLVELQTIAQQSGLASLKAMVQDIENLLAHRNSSTDLGTLVSNLLTNTFKGDPSWNSNRPRILQTYTLLHDHKTALVPALRAAGMVDAVQAAAQLYLDHQTKPAHYCFVEFAHDAQPTIQLSNFWNPLMRADQAVCNSVHLGKGGDNNMLLTGPNGSGKSVNMKGIALNIILAQVFGIAAADEATLNKFTFIETYLNEQEDLQQGLSTFMAESKKLDDICRRIGRLKNGEFGFVLMDEMLKGTVEEAGAQKVYEAGEKIAKQPRVIVIMATHFEKPTDLETDTNGKFVNYHVGLEEHEEGEFTRTFKLIRGANLWWFHDAAKRLRFINWLTSLNS